MTITTAYDRVLRPITCHEAAQEPDADSLFIEQPNGNTYPRIIVQTTIEVEGHSSRSRFTTRALQTFSPSYTGRPSPRRSSAGRASPIDPRGAAVVATAAQILELGKAAGWSNALEIARVQVRRATPTPPPSLRNMLLRNNAAWAVGEAAQGVPGAARSHVNRHDFRQRSKTAMTNG